MKLPLLLLASVGGALSLRPLPSSRRAALKQAALLTALPSSLSLPSFALADEITTTPTGLKYIEVKEGTGL